MVANHQKASGRLSCWPLKLSVYDMDVEHQKGTENNEADTLSITQAIYILQIKDTQQAQSELQKEGKNETTK